MRSTYKESILNESSLRSINPPKMIQTYKNTTLRDDSPSKMNQTYKNKEDSPSKMTQIREVTILE